MRPAKAVRLLVERSPAVFARFELWPARCIFSSACGLSALAELGVEAEPLSVHAALMNRALLGWLEEGQPGGREEAVARGSLFLETDKHPFEHVDPASNAWRGHMVLVVPALDCLLDLDLGQMSRPEKGVVLPGAAAFQWSGRVATFEMPGGHMLTYKPLPGDRFFEQTNDWRWRTPGHREVIAALVRAVKKGK